MNKSIVRWAGGKYRNLKHILPHLPQGKRLVEPFAGGAVVSLNTEYEEYWINDICEDLTNLYSQVIGHGRMFLDVSNSFFTPFNNTKDKYIEERKAFNESENYDFIKAVRFLYLNRHGFNGLCRYSKKGNYNVPFGDVKKPYFPKKELELFHNKFKYAQLSHYKFQTILKSLEKGDVVYCDPPYIPLSETANFSSYDKTGFSMDQHIELAKLAEASDVPVLVSNHDTPLTRQLYKNASEILSYSSNPSISCEGHSRNPVKEILAIFC